jgi:hypothetical protein
MKHEARAAARSQLEDGKGVVPGRDAAAALELGAEIPPECPAAGHAEERRGHLGPSFAGEDGLQGLAQDLARALRAEKGGAAPGPLAPRGARAGGVDQDAFGLGAAPVDADLPGHGAGLRPAGG